MRHATHMVTPVGRLPIRPEIARRIADMTDREVADAALGPFIDPEFYAELLARGLSGPGMYREDTYRLIEERAGAS